MMNLLICRACGQTWKGEAGQSCQACQERLERRLSAAELVRYRYRCLRVLEPLGWSAFRCRVLESHPACQAVNHWLRGLFYSHLNQLPRDTQLLTGSDGILHVTWAGLPRSLATTAIRFTEHQLQRGLDDFYMRLPQIHSADRNWAEHHTYDPQWCAEPFAHLQRQPRIVRAKCQSIR